MTEKFNKLKKELKELADILNAFKSEAVQLKIVELLFDYESEDNQDEEKIIEPAKQKKKRTSTKKTGRKKKSKNTKKTGSTSQSNILERLIKEGFFDKPKTVGDIIKYCDTSLAKKFKSTDISPYLTTRTRNGSLNRIKNPESKQYEYTKA